MAKLAVRDLTKTFGANAVLREISFEVADGEFCVLLGPSGCGKTTLLRLVAGLEEAASGSVVIGGRRVDHLPPRERDVAFVFQNYALYPHLTVFDNLAFSLRLRRLGTEEIRARVLEAAGLLEIDGLLGRRPQELSGGQRQRVAVGRAIVREPKIFLFDEPLSNLDATLRASMRVELARLHRRLRATILYVTHDQAEAMTLAEKIIVLNRGEIQQSGPPSAIYRKPVNTFVAGFVGSPPMNLIEGRLAGNHLFTGEDLTVDLSHFFAETRAGYTGKTVTLGIRPEDLQPTAPEKAWIHGEVEILEDLGSDRFVRLRCGRADLVARVPANCVLERGATVHLTADADRLHLFYQGRRIN